MKSLEKRNALHARIEAARKVVVRRNKQRQAESLTQEARTRGGRTTAAIERTCACGMVIKGVRYFTHIKACPVVLHQNEESVVR